MERRYFLSFIGRRGKGKRRSEAVAELGRCAINGGSGGSVEWRGGAVSGRGKAGRRRSGRLHGVVEEAEGRGEAGDGGTAGGRRGEERGGRRPEVEEA
jgi:hypothetical protein